MQIRPILALLLPVILLHALAAQESAATPEAAPRQWVLPGAQGNVPLWLISKAQAKPNPVWEGTREAFLDLHRRDPGPTKSADWIAVNSGPQPVALEAAPDRENRTTYACTMLKVKQAMAVTFLLNATSQAKFWVNDTPAVGSRVAPETQGEVHTVRQQLRLEAGEHLIRVRLEANADAAGFMLFAATADPDTEWLRPLHAAQIGLPPGSPPPLRAPPARMLMQMDPPFVDPGERLRAVVSMDLAGVVVPQDGFRVRFVGRPDDEAAAPWLAKTVAIDDISEVLTRGVRLSHPVRDPPPWSRLLLSAVLLDGTRELGRASTEAYCEASLNARAQALRKSLTDVRSDKPHTTGLALAQLAVDQIERLTRDRQRRTATFGRRYADALDRAEDGLVAYREGRDPMAGREGLIESAYVSSIDGSAQPYLLYIPPRTEATDEPFPFVTLLHGYVPSYSKAAWMTITPEMQAACREASVALLLPFGRSCSDFLTIGEVDVLDVQEIVTRQHGLDRNRSYLVGYSMGGSGVWTMLSHYPGRAAAATIFSGRTDWYYWHREKLKQAGVNRETLPLFKRVLIDTDNPYHLSQTLRDVPLLVVHPKDDALVKAGHSTRILKKLRPPNGRMQLRQPTDGMGHWHFTTQLANPATYAHMLKHRITPPTEVEHITYTPKYGRKHWLEVSELQRWGQPARVRARIEQHARRVVLESFDNIGALTLYPAKMPQATEQTGETFAVVDAEGTPLPVTRTDAPEGENVLLRVIPQREQPREEQPRLRKTPQLSGPFKEAISGPFLLVTGTAGTPDEREVNLANTERFVAHWQDWAHGTPRRKLDSEVTAEDRQRYHLICFGSTTSNTVLKDVAEDLPFRFLEDGYAVGPREVRGEALGFCGIYPNPRNGRRYIAIIDGLYYGNSLSFNHKWDLVPDYIIFSHEIDSYDSANTARLGGLFDRFWQYDPALAYPPKQ